MRNKPTRRTLNALFLGSAVNWSRASTDLKRTVNEISKPLSKPSGLLFWPPVPRQGTQIDEILHQVVSWNVAGRTLEPALCEVFVVVELEQRLEDLPLRFGRRALVVFNRGEPRDDGHSVKLSVERAGGRARLWNVS